MIVEDLISGHSASLEGKTFTRGLGRGGSDDSLAIFGGSSCPYPIFRVARRNGPPIRPATCNSPVGGA